MNHQVTRSTAWAAALGLATAMAAAPALAQQQEGYDAPPPPPPQEQQQDYQDFQRQQPQEHETVQVSEAKLDQFVDALNEVHTIRNEAAVQLEQATDTEEAQKLQQEAQQQMIEAVENAGLSVEEYNQIATLMGSDPDLQQRISAKLEERS
jgi:hypothetical protein